MLPKSPGIYKIVNKKSGRIYVGSTRNLDERWGTHIRKLNTNRGSPLLQTDWNEYSRETFEFSVIELLTEVDKLLEREQFYIDTLSPFYNRSPTAGSPLGVKHTPETCTKMSVVRIGGAHTEEHKLAISRGVTSALSSPEVRERISNAMKGRDVSPETGKKLAAIFAQSFIVTNPSGENFEITNLSEFCRQNTLSQGHMSAVANGRRTQHKGWLCQHSPEMNEAADVQ